MNSPEPLYRAIEPQKAAALLMGEKHLTVIGCGAVAEHAGFLRDFIRALPDQCLVHAAQAEYRWAPNDDLKVVVSPVADPSEAAFVTVFAPDNVTNRLVLLIMAERYGGDAAIADITPRLARPDVAPILMLPAPGKGIRLTPELEQGYAVTLESLRAIARGAAIDARLN